MSVQSKTRKFTSFLLALLMTAGSAVSCTGGTENSGL